MDLEVIIPVGPGHEELYKRAANSVAIAHRYSQRFDNVKCRIIDDSLGEKGRSYARNQGVKSAQSEWVFFLDADDEMHPAAIMNAWEYLNHDAVFGQIIERSGQWGEIPRTQIPEIETFEAFKSYPPTMTVQMGHFVRTEVARKYPFSEEMNTGEDYDYYLRLWKSQDCIKINKPLMINIRGEHSQGPKSANGREWSETVSRLINEA